MKTSSLVRLGLVTTLIAWSGLLLAEGQGPGADDIGTSTPAHHAARRKAPKKKPRPKAKRARDAGTDAAAPPAAPPPLVPCATPDAGADNEDDDDEEPATSTGADSGSPRRSRRRHTDGGADAGTDAGSDEDDDDDDDEDAGDDEDTAYDLGVELAGESRLVWRGLAESRGAVLQSSAWAGLYGLRVEGWASYLLNTEGSFGPMSVVGADGTASYTFSLGSFRFAPAFTLLYFPEGLSSSATAEASLGVSYRLGDFRIVSGTNIDVWIEPGAYFGTLGLAWQHAKGPWTVKGLADVGWASGDYNYEYLGRNIAAVDVIHTGVSARYDLGEVLYLELHVDGSGLVAPTLAGSVEEPILLVGGVSIGLDWSVSR